MRIFRRAYYKNTTSNKRRAHNKQRNKHNNSQLQPQHIHRTAGKDYHEKNVTINGPISINVNIGDKHQDTRTLITDVARGVQESMEGIGNLSDYDCTISPETRQEPTQQVMADLVVPGHDRQQVLDQLHRAIAGRSGVEVPRILMVARDMKLLTKVPSWKMARREFGDIGAQSGYYRGKNTMLTEEETRDYTKLLE